MMLTPYSQETAGQPTGLTENPARELANSYNLRVMFFLLAHMPLAYVMEAVPLIATAHALLVLLLGLRWALLGRTRQVMFTLCYVAGAEVLWRMTEARLFWEYGKYAIGLIAFAALIAELRRMDPPRRLRGVSPVLLLVAIVPAMVLAVLDLGLAGAVDPISFNLSAYVALAFSALFFWARPVDRRTAAGMLVAIMAPVAGILFLATYNTITQFDFYSFKNAASSLRSGGFGANQVSNTLSLGALAGFILIILLPRARGARAFIALLMVAMLVQAMLTFSRGGVYTFILSALVFGLHLLRTPVARGRFLLLSVAFIVIIAAFIFPSLDQFTGGSLTVRYQETSTTGRLEIAQADMLAFRDSPIIGVGVGESVFYHEYYMGDALAPHTEFTRLLAEHGVFGIFILALMGWMLLKRYLDNEPGPGRAMSAAMAVWTLTVMIHSATRIAAVPLVFALALVAWQIAGERKPAGIGEHEATALDFPAGKPRIGLR